MDRKEKKIEVTRAKKRGKKARHEGTKLACLNAAAAPLLASSYGIDLGWTVRVMWYGREKKVISKRERVVVGAHTHLSSGLRA